MKKLKFSYPKYVKPIRKIGAHSYTKNGQPWCVIGRLAKELTGEVCEDEDDILQVQNSPHCQLFSITYLMCYKYLVRNELITNGWWELDVTSINDNVDHKNRVLLYNLTWAVLGYTDNQSKNTMQHVEGAREYTTEWAECYSERLTGSVVKNSTIKRFITRTINRGPEIFISF